MGEEDERETEAAETAEAVAIEPLVEPASSSDARLKKRLGQEAVPAVRKERTKHASVGVGPEAASDWTRFGISRVLKTLRSWKRAIPEQV